MAQQIFDQYAPLAKVSANETIPVVAAIAQTRDGKDELLHGTVPFVPGPGGLYVPVSASNRLPVEATLSGSKLARVATQLPGNTTSGSPSRNVNFINSIAAATTMVIRDTTSPVIIESLYLLHGDSFTFSDLRVHFYLRDSDGNLRFVPVFGHDSASNDGGFVPQYFSPERLKNAGGKSNLWELVAWNAAGGSVDYNQVIWRMLTPITALHGYRLVAENVNQSAAIAVRFQVDIREVLLS